MKTIEEIADIALKFEIGSNTVLFLCEKDMNFIKEIISGLNTNSSIVGNYGQLDSSESIAVSLGFKSIYIEGRTLHFSSSLNEFIKRAKEINST